MNLFNKDSSREETNDSSSSPPLPRQPQQLRRPNFLETPSGSGSQFFELGRSMSAPPAEFLTSIQSVFKRKCILVLL